MAGWKLRATEEVVCATRPAIRSVWPKYLLTAGLYALWHKRNLSILTNERVLLGSGIIRRQERSINLRNVAGATFSRSGLSSYANLHSSRSGMQVPPVRIGPMSSRKARSFVYEVDSRL
jgi:hypothetical protein